MVYVGYNMSLVLTYLAKKRLDEALHQFRTTSPSASKVIFHLKYLPYQLYPNFPPQQPEPKLQWYQREKYQGSEEKTAMYCVVMEEEGKKQGINFKFGGQISNTFEGHRLIQWVQDGRKDWSSSSTSSGEGEDETTKKESATNKVVTSLYRQYFEQEKTPNSPSTLLTAAMEAGIPEEEAEKFIHSTNKNEWAMETKMAIREQTGNGIDSVPYIVLEGRRRDFTAVGAKEVEEYLRLMEMVAKESC